MSYPVATKASSAVLSQAASLNSADSKFQLFYFGLQARAELPRLMFAYVGANVEHVSAEWPAMKEKTRFGCLPVMFETTSNGTVLEFAESQAIERYIAKKFNLMGENVWEEQQTNEYVSSIEFQLTNYIKVMFAPAETRHKEAETFHQNFAKWVVFMERHLIENGNNGHFVGNKISWADLKAAVLIGRLSLLLPSGMEVPKLPEALVKVVETVKADPKIAAWMASEEYKKYDANTKGFFKF